MFLKKIMKLGAFAALSSGLSACAMHTNYAKAVDSWVGAPERALHFTWGNPTRVEKQSDGSQLLIYRIVERQSQSRMYLHHNEAATRITPQKSKMLSRPAAVMGHYDTAFWCETSFKVNSVGVIVGSHYDGNNCVATRSGAQRWAFHH